MPTSEAQGLPISLNDWLIIQSFFYNSGDCRSLARFRSPFTTYGRQLFVSFTTDIVSIEEAFCVLFIEFVVDNVLAVFDGVCCCDEHIDASAV